MYLGNSGAGARAGSEVETVAQNMGMFFLTADLHLDDEASGPAIAARLAELEDMARTHGSAIAIGSPYPVTVKALAEWLPTLAAKGIAIAPVTAVGARRLSG